MQFVGRAAVRSSVCTGSASALGRAYVVRAMSHSAWVCVKPTPPHTRTFSTLPPVFPRPMSVTWAQCPVLPRVARAWLPPRALTTQAQQKTPLPPDDVPPHSILSNMRSAYSGQQLATEVADNAAEDQQKPKQKKASLEVNDPEIIFQTVIKNLKAKHGEENLCFPKDIMWLAGAPGAGKGAMTPFIQEIRGIKEAPLEMSYILNSPEAKAIKERGGLVGDRIVVEALMEALLQPKYKQGVIVDGFPRTKVQAECIKLFHAYMKDLRRRYDGSTHARKFRRPIFHITVLFVEEQESVQRQLKRGQAIIQHNKTVDVTGVGSKKELRPTDVDPELARERYRVFKEQVFDSLQVVKERFHFHFINAAGTLEEVKKNVQQQIEYQSRMELGDDTFEVIRRIPLASEVIINARHNMVQRLDYYERQHPSLFHKVVDVIRMEFANIIKRQALAGKAIIRSENPVFLEPEALDMALDVLSERGFVVCLDFQRRQLATGMDLTTGQVQHTEKRVYEFQIEFPRPVVRRG